MTCARKVCDNEATVIRYTRKIKDGTPIKVMWCESCKKAGSKVSVVRNRNKRHNVLAAQDTHNKLAYESYNRISNKYAGSVSGK